MLPPASEIALGAGLRALMSLALPLVPVAGYLLLIREGRRGAKAVGIALLAALALALSLFDATRYLLAVVGGVLYYAACAAATYALAARLSCSALAVLTRTTLFCALYVVLPLWIAPGPARSTFLILGWDLVLKSHSYCAELPRRGNASSLSESLFFLLVNPTLVYGRHGERVGPIAFHLQGLARALAGLAIMFGASAILRPLCSLLRERALATEGATYVVLLALFGLLRVSAEYASHSGLASLRIGLMRQLGRRVPERYLNPLAARDPLDFWRRWNTYVSTWLHVYVFVPCTRFTRARWPETPTWLPLLVTFAVSGLLHDSYASVRSHKLQFVYTQLFLFMFIVAIAARLLRAPLRGALGRPGAHTLAARPLLFASLACAAWTWG
jgi:MBOAT, membrane-bound O-acyltransferase family